MHPRRPGRGEKGAGHGMIGMRERAVMLGGHLEAGPAEEGGFLVTAVLPDAGDQVGGSSMTVRVVIADDQGMVRSGFTTLLNSEPGHRGHR